MRTPFIRSIILWLLIAAGFGAIFGLLDGWKVGTVVGAIITLAWLILWFVGETVIAIRERNDNVYVIGHIFFLFLGVAATIAFLVLMYFDLYSRAVLVVIFFAACLLLAGMADIGRQRIKQ